MPKENMCPENVTTKESPMTAITLNCLINKARATKLAISKYTR